MANHICHIVPSYILSDIIAGQNEEARRLAEHTLASINLIHESRLVSSEQPTASLQDDAFSGNNVVPDYVLEDIANAEASRPRSQQFAAQTRDTNRQIRGQGFTDVEIGDADMSSATTFTQSIYDMKSQVDKPAPGVDLTYSHLPGELVYSEGQGAVADKAVNQVHDNSLKVLEFYETIFQYTSLDGKNMPVVSSVHFEKNFQNASWYGVDRKQDPPKVYNQMIYGDGGHDLVNFTNCIDVIGHEITHAVTQFNSGLIYRDESGALNEHISDVFGAMVQQWVENQKAEEANWLVGEGCFMPDKKGVALRNMKNPGTAYDKMPSLGGKDPQPAHYDGIAAFKADPTHEARLKRDHGGVHLFSGVPNRAFVLTALGFGGYSWEKAGQIWWVTVTTNRIQRDCTFLDFGKATMAVAGELFGDDAAEIVRKAWDQVGIVIGS